MPSPTTADILNPPRYAIWVVYARVRGNETVVANYPYRQEHAARELARIAEGGWVVLVKVAEPLDEPIFA